MPILSCLPTLELLLLGPLGLRGNDATTAPLSCFQGVDWGLLGLQDSSVCVCVLTCSANNNTRQLGLGPLS